MKGKNKQNHICYISKSDFQIQHHVSDWIGGICNKGSTNPAYICMVCEVSDYLPNNIFLLFLSFFKFVKLIVLSNAFKIQYFKDN